jgi:hypothetical protein
VTAYNVFRTRLDGFYCAVPEDKPVPAFVGSKAWEFRGTLDETSRAVLPRSFKVALRFSSAIRRVR